MLHSCRIIPNFSSLAPLSPVLRHHPPFLSASHYPLYSGVRRPSERAAILRPWLAVLLEPPSTPAPIDEAEGPIEIPSNTPSSLFAINDNPTPLQTATSVLLTGSITVFLFRSLRRRAQRAKELRVRSTGVTKAKDLKEEALDSLKAIGVGPVEGKGPPSPVQALLGGIAAGVIALILYKFTTTVEAALNRQTISDSFSVRQLTITIRTIINGLFYLATFAFGLNSVGLVLYSIQLAFSSVMEGASNNPSSIKSEDEQSDAVDPSKTLAEENESDSRNEEFSKSSDEP
ncbi:hypothetical protein KSP39_PZI022972 [Platanthera zijinensis]|uniref:Transmembrane protein n=1 Tax=Platanthera zijinensis TaxID=2320716 RepID=A0AAP0FV68_9ASPA